MIALSETHTPVDHLQSVLAATAEVLNALELLESCRFGPPAVIEAAITDLSDAMVALDQLGPKGGFPPLQQLEEEGEAAAGLCGMIRRNVLRIREESGGLSLELRRMLADTREVISVATGSAGMYDALGRTTPGNIRRSRSPM